MTNATKAKDIQRSWYLVDVNGKVLGRVVTEIVQKLMGKHKPYFVKNLDCGDYIVVTNAAKVVVTGKKGTDKVYYRHSMYPGGFKGASFKEVLEKNPEEIIRHAVKGMLPQNKLRATMLKRLFVFPGPEHTYQDKLKTA
ncbi:MAG TPA: 50S ribosomal protein L13 [Patescibacteria group bacterium]|nr:50S ribosomal protein L13 [Patescibacteria group bacterium]